MKRALAKLQNGWPATVGVLTLTTIVSAYMVSVMTGGFGSIQPPAAPKPAVARMSDEEIVKRYSDNLDREVTANSLSQAEAMRVQDEQWLTTWDLPPWDHDGALADTDEAIAREVRVMRRENADRVGRLEYHEWAIAQLRKQGVHDERLQSLYRDLKGLRESYARWRESADARWLALHDIAPHYDDRAVAAAIARLQGDKLPKPGSTAATIDSSLSGGR